LRASGKLTANRFLIRNLAANHLAAKVSLDKGKLAISDLRGDWLGGQHRGDWTADFSVKPPVYTGSGTLNGISLAQLAGAMKDDWITGTANGTYRLTATGSSAAEFWQSIEGTLQFDMRDGALPHISLVNDAGMLRVDRFQGHSRLRADNIEINDGLLYSGDRTFLVSGKASLKQELNFTLTRSGEADEEVDDHSPLPAYSITGTVTEPRVAPVSNAETQAKLKP
jgi:AsmA protein